VRPLRASVRAAGDSAFSLAAPPRPPRSLPAQAEGILKKGGGLMGMFGGGKDRFEDAAAVFNRAGMSFKAVRKWAEAARAYKRAAECHVKVKSESEAAMAYTECARAYVKAGDGKSAIAGLAMRARARASAGPAPPRRGGGGGGAVTPPPFAPAAPSPAAATEVMEHEALARLVDAGRMSQAAKLYNELAELLEAEGMADVAIANYEKASDLFVAENATSSSHKALIRVAHLCATLEPAELDKAADTFAKVAGECLSNNLLKFQAKGYFFNAFLCILARTDVVAADAALERFKEMDYTFPGSRECKLCEDVLQSFKDANADAFTDAIYNYDQISKLDPWKTTLLLKIKTAITGGGDGAGAGGEGGINIM
jgi:alpha-soluble NSF attachment protein